jgi:hypothetical protein
MANGQTARPWLETNNNHTAWNQSQNLEQITRLVRYSFLIYECLCVGVDDLYTKPGNYAYLQYRKEVQLVSQKKWKFTRLSIEHVKTLTKMYSIFAEGPVSTLNKGSDNFNTSISYQCSKTSLVSESHTQ